MKQLIKTGKITGCWDSITLNIIIIVTFKHDKFHVLVRVFFLNIYLAGF